MRAQDRELKAMIAIPRAALEPLRSVLSESAMSEASAQDHRWAHKMQDHVSKTPVTLRAIIEKPNVALADIVSLSVGSFIDLPIGPSGRLKLDCEGKPLFWCALGQKDGRYTVRIGDAVSEVHPSEMSITPA